MSAENFLANKSQTYQSRHKKERISIAEFLERCKDDPMLYASPYTRLLKAIGKAELVDTSSDPKLQNIYGNIILPRYPAFKEFYGVELPIAELVAFLTHAEQGLEESKQIPYLLGPVGSGKSSVAERLKELIEEFPVAILCDAEGNTSPFFESPLGLFDKNTDGEDLEENFNIHPRFLRYPMSPWAVQLLADEYTDAEGNSDFSKFTVKIIYPSQDKQRCVAKVEPGDENNQDISSLVGQLDLRHVDVYGQSDIRAYEASGGLNRANQGVMDFVEMFKAPLKVLHPLLTATQEGKYNGTEAIGNIPFQGMVFAHSNESEWESFSSNTNNEAFLDRVKVIKFPYCLDRDDEVNIYKQYIKNSGLDLKNCAPHTLEILANMTIASRLTETNHSTNMIKIRAYAGEPVTETEAASKAAKVPDYQAEAKEKIGRAEGMSGIGPRAAYKMLSKAFNHDLEEIGAANPVHMLAIIQTEIMGSDTIKEEEKERLISFLDGEVKPEFFAAVDKDIKSSFLEKSDEYGQNKFEQYLYYAEKWVDEKTAKDRDTHEPMSRSDMDDWMSLIEKPAGVANPKDFRDKIVRHALRYAANHDNQYPHWMEFEDMKEVIEKSLFSNLDDFLPLLSFDSTLSEEQEERHEAYVTQMEKLGYTKRQVKIISAWYVKSRKSYNAS